MAYATTGSLAEAEDCVQEAWLRLLRVPDPESIRDLAAWLTTAVSRLALDVLGSARARRERYVGPWLPEPLVEDLGGTDPADRVTLDESVSMALLVVLERLTPAERTSFLLHDVFGMSFAEIADRGRPVSRRRAPARVPRAAARGRGPPALPAHRPRSRKSWSPRSLRPARQGDLEGLVALLDPDVVWRADGGGKVTASRRVAHGAGEVAPLAARVHAAPAHPGADGHRQRRPGLVLRDGGGVLTVVAFTVDEAGSPRWTSSATRTSSRRSGNGGWPTDRAGGRAPGAAPTGEGPPGP